MSVNFIGKTKRYNRVALVLAIGLVMLAVHNPYQPLLQYIFIPQIGMALIIGATGFLFIYHWEFSKENLGPKVIWIPLAVIAGSGVLRLVVQPDLHTLAGALFMVSMFGLYVISRQYGERALDLFMPAVIVLSVSIIVTEVLGNPVKNGGLFFVNYALATEFLLFGFIVSPKKHQWWLSILVVTALFLTGSEEGAFCCAVLGVILLIRKDWGRKFYTPLGVLALILIVSTTSGVTQRLYGRSWDMVVTSWALVTGDTPTSDKELLLLSNNRWGGNWRLSPIRPLGYGVKVTELNNETQHNTVLLITEQIGPVAAVAWVLLIVMGIWKTKWKYAFVIMALIGVWQPLSWTQTAPYLWVLAGVASASKARNDLIFREEEGVNETSVVVTNHLNEVRVIKEGGV